MLIANGKNMQNDILISVTVLLGLFFTFVLHLQILDTITALIVSFFIMRVGYKLFIETYTELMDGIDDASLYNEIFKAIKKVEGAKNPHRARLRKLGNLYNLVIDIEVDGNIPVKKAHEIALNVENSIKKSMENIYDIHVHIEPIGNIENDEKFGISGKDIE